MTFYNVSSCTVSHQCELLNVSAIVENYGIGKTTLYTGGTNRVSRQYELSNVSAKHLAEKMTLYKGSRK